MSNFPAPRNTEPWKPNPGVQEEFLKSTVAYRCYGGARAGGKTAAVVADFGAKALQNYAMGGREFTGLILRRQSTDLKDVRKEAQKQFADRGLARYVGPPKDKLVFRDDIYGPHVELQFGYLDSEEDLERYHGHNLQWLCYEEAGEMDKPDYLRTLQAGLRNAGSLPTFMIISCNPGGVGDSWIEKDFVLPAKPFHPFRSYAKIGKKRIYKGLRVFFPATLDDNPKVNKEEYEGKIAEACEGNPNKYRAWRFGVFGLAQSGAMFDEWDPQVHVVDNFNLPPSWTVYRSFDWGTTSPYACLWGAESDGSPWYDTSSGSYRAVYWPRGTRIIIGELYGAEEGEINKGLEQGDDEIVKAMLDVERRDADCARADCPHTPPLSCPHTPLY